MAIPPFPSSPPDAPPAFHTSDLSAGQGGFPQVSFTLTADLGDLVGQATVEAGAELQVQLGFLGSKGTFGIGGSYTLSESDATDLSQEKPIRVSMSTQDQSVSGLRMHEWLFRIDGSIDVACPDWNRAGAFPVTHELRAPFQTLKFLSQRVRHP